MSDTQDSSCYVHGTENPVELFTSLYRVGTELLVRLKNRAIIPENQKRSKLWNTTQAAKLAEVSRPTFRKILEKYNTMPGIITLGSRKQKSENKKFTLQAINFIRDIAKTRYIRPLGSQPLIICIANLKGGVTKTETAISLGQKSAIGGLRTLIIDLDPQATSTAKAGKLIPDIDLKYEQTIVLSILENPSLVHDIIIHTNYDGLDILPANLATHDCDSMLPDASRNNSALLGSPYWRLHKILELIKHKYDLILIDCPPNTGYLNLNAMCSTNGILIPVPPNTTDLASFLTFTSTLRSFFMELEGKKLHYLKILLAKHNGSIDALEMETAMRTMYGRLILENHMCETVEVAKAANEIGSIYDISRPRGNRKSYNRALKHLDDVNMEIIGHFKDIWLRQSLSIANTVSVTLENAING